MSGNVPNACGTSGVSVPTTANTLVTFGNFNSGTYLYCNNPEQILNTSYLGDSNLGKIGRAHV